MKRYQSFLLVLIVATLNFQTFSQQKSLEKTIKYNGKPFFPLGFYFYPDDLNNPDDKELDLLVKAGFNTIHIDVKDSSNSILFFDQCYKKGLKIIAQFGSGFGKFSMGDVTFLPKYMNHPALLGWSIADDANNGKYVLDTIYKRQKIVKATKPSLPTFLSVYQNYEKNVSLAPEDLLGTGDVLSFEMYPIDSWGQAMGAFTKEEELLETEKELAAFQEINFRKFNKILLAIPQTFSWASYTENKKARLLEADELRNLTYTGLINGAKGVLNYTFGQKAIPDKNIPNYKLTYTPILWNEVTAIAQEINTLKEVYLYGKRTKIDLKSEKWLRAAKWDFKGRTYLIVTNLNKIEAQNFDLDMSNSKKIVNVFSSRNASLSLKNRKLQGSIPAKQVQVFLIK